MKFEIIKKPFGTRIVEINNFVSDNWDDDSSDSNGRENFDGMPDIIVMAYSNNKMVGLLGIQMREFILDNFTITAGCIGNVVTHLDHRGKGVATQLLAESITAMKKEKVDISFLTNLNTNRSLYKRAGFFNLGRPYEFISKSGEIKQEKTGMIAPAYSQEIFDKIMSSSKLINVGIGNI